MKNLAIGFIRAYQILIGPAIKLVVPGVYCRHAPSCSEYTARSIRNEGVVRGVWLGLRRIVSCNPFVAREAVYKL